MSYRRYAVYYLPPEAAFSAAGASWLGWDLARGKPVAQPDIAQIESVTNTPRKYGFHATLKPPFALAEGARVEELMGALSGLSETCAPARSDGLEITALGRFLALTLRGEAQDVSRVAARCVQDLDIFRAPASKDELARRRKANLSGAQEDMLLRWGYPHVLEEFRFHMTLTARLPREQIEVWKARTQAHISPLPEPFVLCSVALVGERADGCFELIKRYPLTG